MQKRQMRLAEEIRDIVANTITIELSDQRTRGVVVTHVRLSPDSTLATVYFRFYGDGYEKEEVQRGLESCKGYLKGTLSKTLDYLRRVPDLRFVYDESVEEGSRIEGLLSKLKPD
jgi:ribosome-binding factor A